MTIDVDFLTPVLALVLWTLVMWVWMYALRLPAFSKYNINPDDARHPGTYSDKLPAHVRSAADNYNHLHEQPTIFYALMFFMMQVNFVGITKDEKVKTGGRKT